MGKTIFVLLLVCNHDAFKSAAGVRDKYHCKGVHTFKIGISNAIAHIYKEQYVK